jgi:gas vesicle protein
MSAQKILIGTASALVTGIAIGLLVAPAKGSETRQKIADSAETLRRKLRNIRNSASSELDELQDIFENEADGLREDVKEKIMKLIEASKKSFNNVKAEARAN